MYYLLLIVPIFIFYPLYLIEFIASILASIYCFLKVHRYKLIEKNIKYVFPEKETKEVKAIAYKSTKVTFMNYLVGLFGQLLYKYSYYFNTIKYKIPEEIKEDIERNGIVLVGSHYSLFLNSAIYFGIICNCVTNLIVVNQGIVHNLLYPKGLYKNYNHILFKKGQTLNNIIKNNSKDIIGLACDHRVNNENYPNVMLLNKNVKFPVGPGYLIKNTNRKLWSFNFYYDEKNKKTILNLQKINVNDSDTIDSISQKIADNFSQLILNNPEQYYWIHDRFKLGRSNI